jgi:RpiR family transcriptional regulator, carbohydrate utilization regulator
MRRVNQNPLAEARFIEMSDCHCNEARGELARSDSFSASCRRSNPVRACPALVHATSERPMPPRPKISSQTNNSENILEVARKKHSELRKSDRKVCYVVLADPKRMLNATVAETAEWAGVSQPTVIRFCTSIGCQGYQDFKLRLAQSLALGTPATHSVILETDTPADVAEKIFDYTITSLDWVRRHIDVAAISIAIDALEKANRIEFFGFGASGIVARDAQQKFPMFGVPCGAESDSHQQIMVASQLKPGDVVVVISNTGATRSIIEVASLARARGTKVIGIMGMRGPLAEYCDIVLFIETLENTNIYTPTISRIAALAVIDILSTAVALRRGEDHIESFTEMKRQLRYLRTTERI